jgi:hypothetical protein
VFLANGVELWRLRKQADALAVVFNGLFGILAFLAAFVTGSVPGMALSLLTIGLIVRYLLLPRNRHCYFNLAGMSEAERRYMKWRYN